VCEKEGAGLAPSFDACRGGSDAYPFLWFFFDWLCWDEFLDSARLISVHQWQYKVTANVLAIATDLCVESSG
jgi:hypothetical protein